MDKIVIPSRREILSKTYLKILNWYSKNSILNNLLSINYKFMNKRIFIFSLVVGLVALFGSCNNEHKGFKKTKSGIFYKKHIENKDGRAADTGDILTMDMIYRLKDTLLFDSRMNSQPMMLTLVNKQYDGDIYEALSLLNVGDSVTFIIKADQFFLNTAGMRELPDFVNKGDDMFFHVKLNNAQTEAELREAHEEMAEKRKELEPQEIAQYLVENNITTAPLASGLYFIEKEKGVGSLAKDGDRLKVHFIISTIDGSRLFSTYDQDRPMDIEAGKKFDTDGVTEALSMMRKGGKATAIVPSELAFGVEGRGEMVPPYTTVIYEIEIADLVTKEEYQKQQEKLHKEQNEMEEQNRLKEKANILKYLQENNYKASPTPSGLYYIEQVKGDGAKPTAGQKVKVHYTGKLLDGKKFDSSVDRGQPLEFQLGIGQVIRGWDEGIALMNVGSKGLLIIPSELGYGKHGAGDHIPGNSTLVFEVELLGIE